MHRDYWKFQTNKENVATRYSQYVKFSLSFTSHDDKIVWLSKALLSVGKVENDFNSGMFELDYMVSHKQEHLWSVGGIWWVQEWSTLDKAAIH